MDSIQRYTYARIKELVVAGNDGRWCDFKESEAWHLADKITALTAQAEEHERDLLAANMSLGQAHDGAINRLKSQHGMDLAAQAKVADSLWEDRLERDLNRLRNKHANELAEKNQMHMSAMQAKDQYYIKKLAEARGEGEPTEPLTFRDEMTNLINRHSKENGSDTPDFILARFLDENLGAWDRAICQRADWYRSKEVDDA